MTTPTPSIEDGQVLPAGIFSELAVQFGRDMYSYPFLRIVKRTRRSTSHLTQLVPRKRLFTEAEVTDLVTIVGQEIIRELEITNGVQLALRLD